jgi:thiol-disulfide isomerase/thioredoxin
MKHFTMVKLFLNFVLVVTIAVGFCFSTAKAAVDLHKDLVQLNPTNSGLNPALASALTADGKSEHQPNKKLVYFWASWCPSCGEKLAHVLPDFAKKHTDVAIQTVNLDEEEERATHAVKKQGIKLPVFYDRTGKLKEELNISAVPHWMTFKRDSKDGEWVQLASEDAFDLEKVEKSLK